MFDLIKLVTVIKKKATFAEMFFSCEQYQDANHLRLFFMFVNNNLWNDNSLKPPIKIHTKGKNEREREKKKQFSLDKKQIANNDNLFMFIANAYCQYNQPHVGVFHMYVCLDV